MSELLEKLGIHWQLLLAQILNFLVILFVLKKTVYGPLVKMLNERRAKVEQGIRDADRASEQLKDADKVFVERVSDADKKSMDIIARAEKAAKEKESSYLLETKEKEKRILEGAERKATHIEETAREIAYEEAAALVKETIKKVANNAPDAIDEALVLQAIAEVKKMRV
jgi:F-type H+-transporting ATPase subunit b